MSTEITEYPCLNANTWEVYPRVFYFRGRFLDLHKRLQRIIKAIPKVLHDETLLQHLLELTEDFEKKTLSIIVIGRENLTPEGIFVSPDALRVTEGNVQALRVTEGNVQTLRVTEGNVQDTCTTIAVCYVTICKLDRRGIKDTVQTMEYFNDTMLTSRSHVFDFVIVMCRTRAALADEESEMFRQNVFSEAPKSVVRLLKSITNIVISSDEEGLKRHISTLFESRIVEALVNIRTFLSQFVPDSTLGDQNKIDLLKDRSVTRAIRGFLRNGFWLSEFANKSCDRRLFNKQIIVQIAHILKCVVIIPMSSKYTLPSWICNRLLIEIKFEDGLVRSVSKRTDYHITKLHLFAITCKDMLLDFKDSTAAFSSNVVQVSKCTAFDNILPYLQNDFRNATVKAEKTMSAMKALKNTIRKMIFETNGYLKQTIVKHDNIQQESTLTIPDSMRRDIMLQKGVYGMGTMYGALEIHLDEEDGTQNSDLTERVKNLIREHKFHNTYHIRYLKH